MDDDTNKGALAPSDFSAEAVFQILFEHARPTSKEISEGLRGKSRDSLGIAWLVLHLVKKDKTLLRLKSLDVSECTLSSGKIFLLLDSLPRTTGELKIGPSSSTGPAFPRLCHFLETAAQTDPYSIPDSDEETSGPSLKSLSFAAGCVEGPQGASLFPFLPSSLEELSFRANKLEEEGAAALAKCFREGGRGGSGFLAGLVRLNLDFTGLDGEGLGHICSAFVFCSAGGRPIRLESLSLAVNEIGESGMKSLCDAVRVGALPCLRSLRLAGCGVRPGGFQNLVNVMREGKFKALENLDLESCGVQDQAAQAIAAALQRDFVPSLKSVNLKGAAIGRDGGGALVSALISATRPPLECVDLSLILGLSSEDASVLGSSELSFIRSLTLSLGGGAAWAFLKSVVGDFRKGSSGTNAASMRVQCPSFSLLDLSLRRDRRDGVEVESTVLRMMGDALRSGRLSRSLRKLSVVGFAEGLEALPVLEGLRYAPSPFLYLSDLDMSSQLTVEGDSRVAVLAEGVRAGCFPNLRKLNLSKNHFGREGMESLMKAVCESETGVDLLESFNVAETRAGEGVKSLGTCLVSGKLSNLKLLYLNRSGVSDEGMLSVALAVEGGHLGGLRVLDLSQNDFGRNGAEAFFASLSPSSCSFLPPHSETPVSIKGGGRLPFLESLLVYETRAGESISLFARVLQKDHCPNIRSLDFDNAGVGDSGIVSLSEIFHHTSLPSLLHLGLRRNNIGIEGLTTFLEALLPSSLPRLHWLFLEGNPLAVHVSESRFLFQKARKEGKLPRLESPML